MKFRYKCRCASVVKYFGTCIYIYIFIETEKERERDITIERKKERGREKKGEKGRERPSASYSHEVFDYKCSVVNTFVIVHKNISIANEYNFI